MKEYSVSDLFFTDWDQVGPRAKSEVFALQQAIRTLTPGSVEYGFTLIQILRRLRKNKSLVNKINVEQAVDIYNDLHFLKQPWFSFPNLKLEAGLAMPADKMARATFDHFIYADNEFSMFLIKQEPIYLKRLIATIYQVDFDKEEVEAIAAKIRCPMWQMELVFFTYAHVRDFVTKRCKTLLPAPSRSEDELSQPSPTGALWLRLKHRLAETPAFQGYDKAGGANMYSALDYLEDLAQQKDNAKS